ncbi:lipopolysaccharide biosynthesis protein [Rugamonas apoptosis]|uniref:Lipopolysaccharide biosynthesis protein n=1 Tax=Rugamonas apoptosis TaxID=2758570 RepID=A0A7W2FED1_9BURK|nr:lipopolysaccharide biosynthesis protein [Rugamonas apoptosis]MBA5690087.1 lipopolysaccharide biosynthesis protein [Rugamonas apoptosis]
MNAPQDLKRKSVSAVKWAAAGTVLRFALQLCTQVVLARMLGPEVYGLFALGLVVMTFSNFLADFGFSWGLIQRQDIDARDIRFAFTWQFLSGAVASVGLFLLAPAVAQYFNEPRVEPIVRWLSLTCVLNAITAPASSLLRRNMDFRALNIIQVASYVIGYLLVGIPCAYLGAGVWTLVAAWLTQTGSAFVLTWVRHPHPLRPLLWYPGARDFTQVGVAVFATNLCNWFLNNVDRIFLGRMLHAHAVGVYNVAYNLANTPNSLFLTALQPAFLASGARLQDDRARLRDAYVSVLAVIWIVIGPMFAALACLGPDLIATLYGPAWQGSGPVFAMLALAMPAYITWGLSTPILWNTGGKHLESLLQLPVLGGAVLALSMLAGQGALTVAMVASATLLARAVVIASVACRRLALPAGALLPLAGRAVLLAALAAAAALGGAAGARMLGTPPLLPLLGGALAAIISCVLAVLLYPRLLGKPVLHMLGRFSPPIPPRLMAYLTAACDND